MITDLIVIGLLLLLMYSVFSMGYAKGHKVASREWQKRMSTSEIMQRMSEIVMN